MDSLSAIILGVSLAIIMLGMGLSLVLADFKRVVLFPKAIVIGLTNQLILLPLIGLGVTMLIPARPEIAIGIMILAACPGGATSNLISHLAKGDTALSVTLTAISSLITIITIPFIVNFALERFLNQGEVIQLDVLETIVQIMAIIIVPVTVGMLIRRYKEKFAIRLEKPVRIASAAVLFLVIAGLLIKESDNIVPYFKEAGLMALALNAGSMIVGFYSARLFKVNYKAALSISIESGIQNGTLAITIAVLLLNNTEYAIAPAIYSLLMFLTGGFLIYIGNQHFAVSEKKR